MDKSWNFLKEAPENELALVREACNKCGHQISLTASSEQMVSSILLQYGLDAEDRYGEFLDKLCNKNSISIEGLNDENKELEILKYLLAKGIERMSNEQIESFASNYYFSNLGQEKLIRETKVRLRTSNMFRAKLYHIVPALFGIDFTVIFPSDVSNITKLILKDCDSGVKHGPVASTLIALKNEHHRAKNDPNYYTKYLDKYIQSNTCFDDERYAILSVILYLVKESSEKVGNKDDSIIDDAFAFLHNKILKIPKYLFEQGSEDESENSDDENGNSNDENESSIENEIIEYLVERLYPCDVNEQVCYGKMNDELEKYQSIAFFEYAFPYTNVLKNSYYLMPNNEFNQHAIKLYLLSHGLNPNEHLVSEMDLRNKSLECAVIPMNCKPADYPSFHKYIQLEDPYLFGFRRLIQEISTIDDANMNIIEAIKLFTQLKSETMDKLTAELDEKAHESVMLNELNDLVHMICKLRNR